MTHAYSIENLWPKLRAEAETLRNTEPALASFVQSNILSANNFHDALAKLLSGKLSTKEIAVEEILRNAAPEIEGAAKRDLLAVLNNDPAVYDAITPFLFFKGFHALQSYRIAHSLWRQERKHLALHLQNRVSDLFGVDIHPAAKIGSGVMMDHATGIVIGETAVVEDDVLFWHGVTLGGKGTAHGDRHPKIRQGAQLSAGSTVLGNTEVGAQARVAAGAVVTRDVPDNVTVAGIPAEVVKKN